MKIPGKAFDWILINVFLVAGLILSFIGSPLWWVFGGVFILYLSFIIYAELRGGTHR